MNRLAPRSSCRLLLPCCETFATSPGSCCIAVALLAGSLSVSFPFRGFGLGNRRKRGRVDVWKAGAQEVRGADRGPAGRSVWLAEGGGGNPLK